MRSDVREILKRILDENDWDEIELVNDAGQKARFAQICVIPDGESTVYAIMQPLDEKGNEAGEFIFFSFEGVDTDVPKADIVTDQYLISDIYDEYRKILASRDGFGSDDEDDDEDDFDDDEDNDDFEDDFDDDFKDDDGNEDK